MRKFVFGSIVIAAFFLLSAGCAQGISPSSAPPALSSPGPVESAPSPRVGEKGWEATLALAQKEGVLMFYGNMIPGERDAIVASFEGKYRIRTEFVIGRAGEISARWNRENAAGIHAVDIFHVGSPNIILPKEAYAPLEQLLILPEVTDPQVWPDKSIPYLDKDKTMVPLNRAWTTYVNFNTEVVREDQLKSYRDLLNPEWKGKLAFFDPGTPGASAAWVTLIITSVYGMEGGKEFLREFAATRPAMTKDVRQLVEWVAKGKYLIGVGAQHSLTAEFKAMGAPVTLARFVEGGNINPGSACLMVAANAPHRNAAAVYANWILSREGQVAYNKPSANPPMRVDVSIEGVDTMKIARPGEKAFLTDEKYFETQEKAIQIAREIFGGQMP